MEPIITHREARDLARPWCRVSPRMAVNRFHDTGQITPTLRNTLLVCSADPRLIAYVEHHGERDPSPDWCPDGVTAARLIDRLCVPIGQRASAWTSAHEDDHTRHAGFAMVDDGAEFVAALGAWDYRAPIRLLPDGGEWPYSFSLAAACERAIVDYCEGDIAVRVYNTDEGYRAALAEYHESAVEHGTLSA